MILKLYVLKISKKLHKIRLMILTVSQPIFKHVCGDHHCKSWNMGLLCENLRITKCTLCILLAIFKQLT